MRHRAFHTLSLLALFLAGSVQGARLPDQPPVQYRVSFPAPEHHYAQVEVTFSGIPAPTLEARMSRSSPGRYAVHEFAKNVFDVHAFDGSGRELPPTRPNPSPVERDRARRHRAHRLQGVRQPRRRHVSGGRRRRTRT